jgi:hypothetical protein
MNVKSVVVIVAALHAAVATPVPGQTRDASSTDLSTFQALSTQSVRRFREQVQGYLTEPERSLEATITYRVSPTWLLNGRARTLASGREIEVSAGHFATLSALSEWALSPRWGATEECVMSYLEELIDAAYENGRRKQSGEQPILVTNFTTFAREGRASCSGFSTRRYERDPHRLANVRSVHGRSISFILAHELAHHLKGHTTSKDPLSKATRAAKLSQSRDNEREADQFALAFITRDGPENAIMAAPAFILTALVSCGKDEEIDSTHPSAAWRWGLLVETLKAGVSRDSEWTRYLRETRQHEAFMSLLDQMGTAFDR